MSDLEAVDPGPCDAEGSPEIDTELVRRLADILNDTGLTTIEVECGELKIRVAREMQRPGVTSNLLPAQNSPSPEAASAEPPLRETLATPAAGHAVKSPMVGTVFLQPQPGSATFVKVGDSVAEGQTLCIIEAMKTMNPVAAPRAGVVHALLVGDGQPVEYGEPLVMLD